MNTKIFLPLLILVPGLALAGRGPTLARADMNQVFSTAQAAAVVGLRESVKTHSKQLKVEWAGVVFSWNGKFYITTPTTSHEDAHFNLTVLIPRAAKVVALFHTHPESPNNQYFSPNDVDVATTMKVDSYVAVLGENQIIEFIPGKTPVRTMRCQDRGWLMVSQGSEVGAL